MNLTQISNFVKKLNFNITIPIKYVPDPKSKDTTIAFMLHKPFFHYKDLHIITQLQINKAWRKYLHPNELKAILAHEVGHLYSGYLTNRKTQTVKRKPEPLSEYEAQLWAFKRTHTLNLKNTNLTILSLFIDWNQFPNNSIYKKAFKLALSKKYLHKLVKQYYPKYAATKILHTLNSHDKNTK